MNYTQRLHTLRIAILGMIVAWGGIFGLAGVARGLVSYEELHAFAHGGTGPFAGVIQDSAGNLYGTTKYEGVYGYGTVYKLEPSTGTLTFLYSFNVSDGANPSGGLIQDSAGNLYGTTEGGGPSGNGTVYKLEPSTGTLTLLHSFNYFDGSSPSGVIQDSAGNLYGTTQYGGASGNGTVYKLEPSTGTFTLLHSFNGSDGAIKCGKARPTLGCHG